MAIMTMPLENLKPLLQLLLGKLLETSSRAGSAGTFWRLGS
jgi:hypothetical protein